MTTITRKQFEENVARYGIEWTTVYGFHKYGINSIGEVINKQTGFAIKPTTNKNGKKFVRLTSDLGLPIRCDVDELLKKSWKIAD